MFFTLARYRAGLALMVLVLLTGWLPCSAPPKASALLPDKTTQTSVSSSVNQPSKASRTITFSYDAAGRLASVNYSNGKSIAYTYDSAGNLTRQAVRFNVYLPLVLRQ